MLSKLQTPCWVINEEAIERQVQSLRDALSGHFENSEIGFSIKTNSMPAVLRTMQKLGCRAEVVSHDEWQFAKRCGFDACHMIYNGPLKSKETFIEALCNDAVVNIETWREIDWLSELPTDKIYSIGLRLNINLSNVSGKDAVRTNDNSRFGFSDESDELAKAISAVQSLAHVRIAGLHLHRTTQARRVNYYKHVTKYASKIIKKYNLNLDYIDIGGGFYGTLPGKPSYEDYIGGIAKTLNEQNIAELKVYVEPGTALIDNAVQFIAEAIDIKKIDNQTIFVTTNGSRFDIDPFFRKKLYICRTISDKDDTHESIDEQTICGCTCIEEDRITILRNQPAIKVGDKIIFSNVGAYTLTLTPQFIRYAPRIYLCANNIYELARNERNANDIYTFNND